MQLGKELAQIDDQAYCYAFMRKTDVETSDVLIVCTISICD